MLCRSMYVDLAVMSMIRRLAIRITELLPELHSRIFRKIGFVLSAALERTHLSRQNKALTGLCFQGNIDF